MSGEAKFDNKLTKNNVKKALHQPNPRDCMHKNALVPINVWTEQQYIETIIVKNGSKRGDIDN